MNSDRDGQTAPSMPGAPEAEPRIGQLTGDRLCATCHFNLSGQTIVRERHYGLLIVRCPECGTAAALQEYPLLGRWASRLGYVLAGVWLLAMLGLVVLGSWVIWAHSRMLNDRLLAPFGAYQQKIWTEHTAESQKAAQAAGKTYQQQADYTWWQSLDMRRVFEDAGGWGRAIGWSGLWFAVYAVLVLGPIGVALAVAAPHARRGTRLAFLLFTGGLAAVYWTMQLDYWRVRSFWYPYYGMAPAGLNSVNFTLTAFTIGIGVASLALGLWLGRPIARGLVRLLLPPRLRGPLAFLWIVDGKAIPRP